LTQVAEALSLVAFSIKFKVRIALGLNDYLEPHLWQSQVLLNLIMWGDILHGSDLSFSFQEWAHEIAYLEGFSVVEKKEVDGHVSLYRIKFVLRTGKKFELPKCQFIFRKYILYT
jgi:hypothetical protein